MGICRQKRAEFLPNLHHSAQKMILNLVFLFHSTVLRVGYASTMPHLGLDYALASISCEHCRSSCNNPDCVPRHIIYYNLPWDKFKELFRNKYASQSVENGLSVSLYSRKQGEKEPIDIFLQKSICWRDDSAHKIPRQKS